MVAYTTRASSVVWQTQLKITLHYKEFVIGDLELLAYT